MSKRQEIREFGGKILGWIDEDSSGNKKAISFGQKVLGRYNKASNTTVTSTGRIVAFGDCVSGFLLPKNFMR